MDNNNIRLFVDMDGTLAKWNNVEFEQLFEKGYYLYLEPNKDIVSEVNNLIEQGEDLYILSCVLPESKYALDEKKEWLKRYVPKLPKEKCIFVPYGQNKADYLKENYSPITSHDYLIDDYTQNLQEWKEFGGVGVKYINGINHTRGTWKGLTIYDENGKLPTFGNDTGLEKLVLSEKLKRYDIELIGCYNMLDLIEMDCYDIFKRCSSLRFEDAVNHDCYVFSSHEKLYFVEGISNIGLKDIENLILNNRGKNNIVSPVDFLQSNYLNIPILEKKYYTQHYPTLSKRRDFNEILHTLDYNTLDNMEYTLYLWDINKISLGKHGEYIFDESVNKQRISIDSINWELGIRKSMKERLNEAQNKAQQKNDQSKERNQQDRSEQVL